MKKPKTAYLQHRFYAYARSMKLREKADYDVYYSASREEAEAIIDDANRFIDRVKRLFG